MALSIKNAETEALARQLAAARGQTITEAITTALRASLAAPDASDDRAGAKLERLRRISADAGPRWPVDQRDVDHGDLLYDDRGLPR